MNSTLVKRSLYLLLPMAAVGPAAYVKGPELLESARSSWSADKAEDAPKESAYTPLSPDQLNALTGPNINDFLEVIRFDITPSQIIQHWPRVVTGLAHLDLQGYRAPLVTGAAVDDLAGSLTYYFNSSHQVEWITFQGSTGDARRLVHLVTTGYKFSPRPTNSPGVFLYEVPELNGQATSYLWVRPAGLINESTPHQTFDVTLVIQRPAGQLPQHVASVPQMMQMQPGPIPYATMPQGAITHDAMPPGPIPPGQPVGASAWTPVLPAAPYH